MDLLVAAAAPDGPHVLHPKVVSVSSDGVDGLFEAHFNFEPPAIEADYVQRVQSQIGAEQDQVAARRVIDPDKADQLAQGAPEQVVAQIAEGNARFSINRTGGFDELLAVAEPFPQGGFVAIELVSAAAPAGRRRERGGQAGLKD